jgi:hypothetical protein
MIVVWQGIAQTFSAAINSTRGNVVKKNDFRIGPKMISILYDFTSAGGTRAR